MIFYGSAQSRWVWEAPDFWSADKLYHFLEYGIFGLLAARALTAYRLFPSRRERIVGALLCSLLYGLSDECHQWFVPGRLATFGDVLADTVGGGLGGWLFVRFSSGSGAGEETDGHD